MHATLTWNSNADIDLHGIEPDPQRVLQPELGTYTTTPAFAVGDTGDTLRLQRERLSGRGCRSSS